jgi:hypothetical protein
MWTVEDFGVFRRSWSALLLGIHYAFVIPYMYNHFKKRDHIAVIQVRLGHPGLHLRTSLGFGWRLRCPSSRRYTYTSNDAHVLYTVNYVIHHPRALNIGSMTPCTP